MLKDTPSSSAGAGGREPGVRPTVKKNAAGKLVSRRKVKPKLLAVVTHACTGCAGAPVCEPYCPVADCMILVSDDRSFPFGFIRVDPLKCVGCKRCLSGGPDQTFLDGCPWDAIIMVPTRDWEAQHGELPY